MFNRLVNALVAVVCREKYQASSWGNAVRTPRRHLSPASNVKACPGPRPRDAAAGRDGRYDYSRAPSGGNFELTDHGQLMQQAAVYVRAVLSQLLSIARRAGSQRSFYLFHPAPCAAGSAALGVPRYTVHLHKVCMTGSLPLSPLACACACRISACTQARFDPGSGCMAIIHPFIHSWMAMRTRRNR